MDTVRPPAVAGMFYPENVNVLRNSLKTLLDAVLAISGPCPKAIIAPHAGYIYSGPTAACIYKRLAPWRQSIRRVVLLGPTHRVPVQGIAIPTVDRFHTPLGDICLDKAALARLSILPQIVSSNLPHGPEHALEVQLPFLQYLLEDFTLVPLAVGNATPEAVAQALEQVWGGDETLIVISSDLSHYLPYDEARAMDQQTCDKILAMSAPLTPREACGAYPINGLLLAARHHGLRGQLVDARNSGDTAGDRHRVVGYAAFAFTSPEAAHAH